MATDIVYDAVQAYLEANWTETTIAWENQRFTEPMNEAKELLPWIAVEIEGDIWDQESIGAGEDRKDNRWQEDGRILIHVMVETGTGGRMSRQISTRVANLFRGLNLDPDIEFQAIRVGPGAGTEDEKGSKGNYWVRTVAAEWIRG